MKYFWYCAIPLSVLLLVGCVSDHGSVEQRLLAAGFVQHSAQEQELSSFPARRIILQSQGKQATYVYADPTYCRCLYVGDSRAYGKFQHLSFLQKLSDEQMAAANLNFMAATSYPWYGYGYPYYYGYPGTYWGAGYYYYPRWYGYRGAYWGGFHGGGRWR